MYTVRTGMYLVCTKRDMELAGAVISKPGYYYDTLLRYYDKCHKGKQGLS